LLQLKPNFGSGAIDRKHGGLIGGIQGGRQWADAAKQEAQESAMFNKLLAAGLAVATLTTGGIALSAAGIGIGATEFGPQQGFSQSLGSKQAVGYFMASSGRCNVTLMVSEALDDHSNVAPPSAVKFSVMLNPAESTEIASAENRSMTITCGAEAKTVALSIGQTPVM